MTGAVAALTAEKQALLSEKAAIEAKALKVRNIFVSDNGSVLNEGRSVVKLKSRIRALEDRAAAAAQLEADLEDTTQKLRAVEKAYYLTQSARESAGDPANLPSLEDPLLLAVFSFLQTEDVLSAAQVSFQTVGVIAGVGSRVFSGESPSLRASGQLVLHRVRDHQARVAGRRGCGG